MSAVAVCYSRDCGYRGVEAVRMIVRKMGTLKQCEQSASRAGTKSIRCAKEQQKSKIHTIPSTIKHNLQSCSYTQAQRTKYST